MTLRAFINDYKASFSAVLDSIAPEQIECAAEQIRLTFEAGRQIFIAGNGGSAATASHMACDLAKTTLGKGNCLPARRIRAIALTDNVPLLSAWGNDVGYECVFAEQLRNLAHAGDLLIVISASGNSPNIVQAVHTAREMGLHTLALLGFEGGAVKPLVDQSIVVRCSHYGHIEDAHSVMSHLITDYLKRFVQAG
ncbi:MAG: SIS domain-containing protein [Anaerolineae bacterium]|jgi:D-sedoheptulose 7-phosphate isomerase|nr:SIS domain-containing protein [Anaerolineae bacterium]